MSGEVYGGPWQQRPTGVLVPVRGALLVPAPQGATAPRTPGRVQGPAAPIAAGRKPRTQPGRRGR